METAAATLTEEGWLVEEGGYYMLGPLATAELEVRLFWRILCYTAG